MYSFDNIIKNKEKLDISGKDITRFCGLHNIIAYHELENIHTMQQLLKSENAVCLVYETSENVGHFVLLYLHMTIPKTLVFFDSYGLKLDEELKYASFNLRNYNGKPTPHLSTIIASNGYNVISDNKQLQSKKEDTSTCGRWVSIRYIYKHLNNDQFNNLFNNNKNSPDDVITYLTLLL